MKKVICVLMAGFLSYSLFAASCTDISKEAENAVKKACKVYVTQGADAAFGEMGKFRFCDGAQDHYVWFQYVDKTGKESKLAFHPVAPALVGPNMLQHKSPKIVELFTKLNETLNKATTTNGAWTEYMWAKPGSTAQTLKKTIMLKCNDKMGAGAGFWP